MKVSKMKCLSLLSAVSLLITSCGTVSQADYDKVVAERDYYKQQYELASGNKQPDVVDSTSPTSDSTITESPAETEMTVEVTLENYKDYFEFIPVQRDLDNYDGTTTPYIEYVIKSNVYDDGWIYREASADFQIDFTDPRGERNFMWRKLEGISTLYEPDAPKLEVLAIKGRLKFEHISAVQSYEVDDFNGKRTVVFSDGRRISDTISLNQAQYPY